MLCLLELYYPATELTIMFHLLLHCVFYQQLWGPIPRFWFFATERMLGFLSRKIKTRLHPEANVTRFYLQFRACAEHRREIERALSASPNARRYLGTLDAAQKLSSTGPSVSGSRFSSV